MEMTKTNYPQNNKTQTLAISLQHLSGTLDNWIKCREATLQAQIRLLQSCKNNEEVERYKAQGLLSIEDTSLLGYGIKIVLRFTPLGHEG